MTIPRTPAVEPNRSAARSALNVSLLTLASRAMGLVRTLVVTSVLGITFLGNTYGSANALPNLLFEIIAGGAVAAALLPALAAAATSGDVESVRQTASAVLNRALLVMAPVVVIGLLAREPLMRLLTAAVQDPVVRAQQVRVGSVLLLMFLPQLWFYSVGVVLTGLLHAYRRFAAPAIAPLLSSAVVTAAYFLYAGVEGTRAGDLEAISGAGVLVLGLGTTLGVVVLSLSLLPSARAVGFRWRPVVAIEPLARMRLRSLVGAAAVTVGAQQVFLGGVLVLANRVEGGVVAYQLAFTTLLVFWAVFPLPLATTLFPGLAAAASDPTEFARRSASAGVRLTTIVFGASALMGACADALAEVVLRLGAGGSPEDRRMIALTIGCLAPGLVGYGLYALYTRSAYALSDGRSPALAAIAGFGAGLSLSIASGGFLEGPALVAGLAGSFSAGILLAAGLLIGMFRRRAFVGALAGLGTAAARGLIAGSASAASGMAAAGALPGGTLVAAILRTGAGAMVAVSVFLILLVILGDRQVRDLVRSLRRSAVGLAP
ncbi:MAG: murein biosynthesis integral membrane protein MurJ [Actinomycetota bacterium]